MCDAPPCGQRLSYRFSYSPGVDVALHPPRPCGWARALCMPGRAFLFFGFPFVRRWSGRDRHAPTMLEGCFVGVSTFGPECRQL